jgi:hypothetical protein
MDPHSWTVTESRPGTPVEVETEPDGTFALHWPGLDILLDRDEIRDLAERVTLALAPRYPTTAPRR